MRDPVDTDQAPAALDVDGERRPAQEPGQAGHQGWAPGSHSRLWGWRVDRTAHQSPQTRPPGCHDCLIMANPVTAHSHLATEEKPRWAWRPRPRRPVAVGVAGGQPHRKPGPAARSGETGRGTWAERHHARSRWSSLPLVAGALS